MASKVKKITGDSDLQTQLISAESKLVVIDFYADWCGPCKVIAPAFEELSRKYPSVVFLKLNVDECHNLASRYDVTSMPTFLFFRNREKIHTVKGGDKSALESAIMQHMDSGTSETADSSSSTLSVPGQINMSSLISEKESECLNNSDEHPLSHALSGNPQDGRYLESDCDEQLIISIAFSQPVKLHTLHLVAPQDGRGPRRVKVFINQPQTLDFDQAEQFKPLQEFNLGSEDLLEDNSISLQYVKYQNIQNITLFVVDNQGGTETTVIQHLAFYGTPRDATNMADFKRVAGERGERHS